MCMYVYMCICTMPDPTKLPSLWSLQERYCPTWLKKTIAMQEHQDTGDPLILPNDIRLLQDHNGQKPHDVAAAFYEEVPEVWEHLKLVRSQAPPSPLTQHLFLLTSNSPTLHPDRLIRQHESFGGHVTAADGQEEAVQQVVNPSSTFFSIAHDIAVLHCSCS